MVKFRSYYYPFLMSTTETSKTPSLSNALHTAIYIYKAADSAVAMEDLKQFKALAAKANSGFKIYADSALMAKLGKDADVIIKVEKNDFPEQVKNILPVTLPLAADAHLYVKWLSNVSKLNAPKDIIVGNGKLNDKAGYFEKWSAYWANFWPKLTTGANANLSASEAVLLSRDSYVELASKGVQNAWQTAAIAEKENNASVLNFELGNGSFVFGDGFKAFFTCFSKGFVSIKNSFFSLASTSTSSASWGNLDYKGYKRIFGIAATLLLALMCWISFDYNVTWDEPNHNTFSKDVLKYYSSFGNDTTMFDFQKQGHRDYYTNVFYGMSIDVWASAVNSIFDIKNEYATRHFFNALIGFLCILFTALIVRLFAGWLPALIALLAMVCSPSFFGHAFNNPKDIPFAAGYIMAVYYLLKLLLELPNARHQTKVMLAIAIGFAISIRVQGILPIAYLFMFIGLYWLINHLKAKNKQVLKYVQLTVTIALGGYILGILFWPYALRDPLSAPFTALKEFEKFSYLTYYELFEGVRIYHKPWYYEPKLIMLTAPLAVLGGFFLGLLLGIFRKDKKTMLAVMLLIFATLFPAFYAIYKKSYVYNGWRHFIFIYPSLVALSILGWFWFSQLFKSGKLKLIIMGVIAITFIKPGVWSIVNHPYQYMYFNEIAGGIEGANGLYETDYWNQTPRAAFEWLVKNKPEVLKGDMRVSSNNIQEALKTFVPEGEKVMYKWTREYEWADDDWKYAIWTTRTLSKNQILGGYWPPKGTIHEIKVDGVTIAAVVKSANDYSYQGKQYLKKNNADSALYFYEKAIAYNPLEEEFIRGAGVASFEKLKKDSTGSTQYMDKAMQYLKKAIAMRDGNYEAYATLGEIYFGRGTVNPQGPDAALLKTAKENFEKALFYKENFSGIYYYLAETDAMLNDFEHAAYNYYKFFEFGQDNQQIYNRFTTILKQAGMTGDEGEPYYYMYTKALEAGETSKAENYLIYHNQITGQ